MNKFLNILEKPQQEETFDEEKVHFINSKIFIWDFYGISQATYLCYNNEEKSKMFIDYYKKLVENFYGNNGKNSSIWFLELAFLYVFCRFSLTSLF